MRRFLSAVAVAVIAVPILESTASAQIGPSLGIRGGVSMPIGGLETTQDMGYNLGVSIGLKPLLSPVGFRAEAAFNQFKTKSSFPVDADARVFEGTANLIFDLFPLPTLSLYAIGGGGLYNAKFGDGDGSTKPGINLGGGLRFGLAGFNAHVEARWHNVFADGSSIRYIPVTVGVSF
jgi:hypothetical protein